MSDEQESLLQKIELLTGIKKQPSEKEKYDQLRDEFKKKEQFQFNLLLIRKGYFELGEKDYASPSPPNAYDLAQDLGKEGELEAAVQERKNVNFASNIAKIRNGEYTLGEVHPSFGEPLAYKLAQDLGKEKELEAAVQEGKNVNFELSLENIRSGKHRSIMGEVCIVYKRESMGEEIEEIAELAKELKREDELDEAIYDGNVSFFQNGLALIEKEESSPLLINYLRDSLENHLGSSYLTDLQNAIEVYNRLNPNNRNDYESVRGTPTQKRIENLVSNDLGYVWENSNRMSLESYLERRETFMMIKYSHKK